MAMLQMHTCSLFVEKLDCSARCTPSAITAQVKMLVQYVCVQGSCKRKRKLEQKHFDT